MTLTGVIACGALLLAAACGSGGSSPGGTGTSAASPSASASPAAPRTAPALTVCQDVNTLRAGLHSLVTVSVTQPAASEIQAVTRGMQAAVADLGNTTSGRTEWRAQIDSLKSDLARLQSAASSYAASPSASGSSSVSSAKASVAAAAQRLLATVGNRCPSPSASPAPSS